MRKFLALLLFIILVFPLLFAAQVTVGVSTWALDRSLYLNAFDQPEVYEIITEGPLMQQALLNNLHLPETFDTTEFSSLVNTIITPEYIHTNIDIFIQGYFDYMQGKETDFSPTLDITPIKDELSGPKQELFLQLLVNSIPTCEPGQVPAITERLADICKPAGTPDEILINQILKPYLPAILAQIPDAILIEEVVPVWKDSTNWQSFIPGMAIPASLILGVIAIAFVAVVAWYGTALISDASWHLRLQWLGWMLIIPSILVFVLGFAIPSSISAYWINFGLENATLPYNTQLNELVKIVAGAMLPRVGNAFQMVGGVCAAFSLAFIFWGIATPRKKTQEIA